MTRSVVAIAWRFLRRLPPGLRVLWRTLVWGFWLVYFSFIVLVVVLIFRPSGLLGERQGDRA